MARVRETTWFPASLHAASRRYSVWRWICDPAPHPWRECGKPPGFPRVCMLHPGYTARGGGSLMAQHGKRYEAARSEIDRETTYSPVVAMQKLQAFPAAKFDETVEVHFRLGLNVRHADEQLRG